MIFFIAPSGGNNSYICLKLLGTNLDGMATYHDKGTHSDDNEIINFLHYAEKTDKTKVIITEDYNNVKSLIIHLGMSGRLKIVKPNVTLNKHDHLVFKFNIKL